MRWSAPRSPCGTRRGIPAPMVDGGLRTDVACRRASRIHRLRAGGAPGSAEPTRRDRFPLLQRVAERPQDPEKEASHLTQNLVAEAATIRAEMRAVQNPATYPLARKRAANARGCAYQDRSTRTTLAPCGLVEKPTAVHDVAGRHDTASRTLGELPIGWGVGSIDQRSPTITSASVSSRS